MKKVVCLVIIAIMMVTMVATALADTSTPASVVKYLYHGGAAPGQEANQSFTRTTGRNSTEKVRRFWTCGAHMFSLDNLKLIGGAWYRCETRIWKRTALYVDEIRMYTGTKYIGKKYRRGTLTGTVIGTEQGPWVFECLDD